MLTEMSEFQSIPRHIYRQQGRNLTSANRVIIFDPDWKPSPDLQVCVSLLIFYITLQNKRVGQIR